jgi:hypothetical protein
VTVEWLTHEDSLIRWGRFLQWGGACTGHMPSRLPQGRFSDHRFLTRRNASRLVALQWVLRVIFPSGVYFMSIVCWIPLSLTTCFGLHGHPQVCRIYCMLVSTVFDYMAIFKCVAVIV